jgi:two-component system, OmpR family, sensor histidine kinase SenX3
VDTSAAVFVGGLIGAALGAASVLAWRFSEKSLEAIPPAPEPVVPPGVGAVLAVLRSSALVVDREDQVLKASAPAHMMGLVNGTRVAVPALTDLVRQVARDGQIREEEIVLEPSRGQTRHVAARVAPLGSRLVLVLVEDRTRERAADMIRRDFVVNVSHELKTPIGALTLLAEAVTEASSDPAAVERFAARMRMESERLGRLVQQIIELSRLQGDEPLEHADVVPINVIVTRAIDRVGVDAADKGIEVQFVGANGLRVRGDGDQLIVALGNLVENAVAYSPDGGRVTVAAREHGSVVELVVTDHGVGIPAAEVDRIFERFYRVDPARARATGGTGLGLSIVKHVAATHGGEVRVWSVPGQGSTFTLVLPALPVDRSNPPEADHETAAQSQPAPPREPVLATTAPEQEETP